MYNFGVFNFLLKLAFLGTTERLLLNLYYFLYLKNIIH